MSETGLLLWAIAVCITWAALARYFSRLSASRTVSVGGAFIAAFFLCGIAAIPFAPDRPAPAASKPERPRPPLVVNSGWDGSVSQVERWLDQNLKDPDSFEAIEWGPVTPVKDGYTVRLRYRARNSFGGYSIHDQLFIISRSGEVLKAFD